MTTHTAPLVYNTGKVRIGSRWKDPSKRYHHLSTEELQLQRSLIPGSLPTVWNESWKPSRYQTMIMIGSAFVSGTCCGILVVARAVS